MSDIFISYASTDRERIQPIVKILEKEGWSVWWDRKIPPGKTFDDVIEEAIDAAKCVIVIWSEKSVKSSWVRVEAGEGNRKGTLIPVLIDTVNIPLAFRRIEAAQLTDWDGVSDHPEVDILLGSIANAVGYHPAARRDHLMRPKLGIESSLEDVYRDEKEVKSEHEGFEISKTKKQTASAEDAEQPAADKIPSKRKGSQNTKRESANSKLEKEQYSISSLPTISENIRIRLPWLCIFTGVPAFTGIIAGAGMLRRKEWAWFVGLIHCILLIAGGAGLTLWSGGEALIEVFSLIFGEVLLFFLPGLAMLVAGIIGIILLNKPGVKDYYSRSDNLEI